MCATDEGRQKGERWCKRAIWGNTLPAVKHVWKTVNKLTSDAFVDMWLQRVNHLYSRYSETATPGRTEGVRKMAKHFGVDPSTVQRISRPFDGASEAA
jgi:hypothetical protein